MSIRYRLVALDLVALGLVLFTFVGHAEPDLLFHMIWVVLIIEAFWYGLRVSAPRIVLAALLVVLFSVLETPAWTRPQEFIDLMFSEWPLMMAIITIVAVMADRVRTSNRDLATLERQTHQALVTAREDERRWLSTDLHDGLGQTLTALVLTLDAAEAGLTGPGMGAGAGAQVDAPRDLLVRAQEIAATALEETREVTHRLRPGRLEEMGLTTAIRELAAKAGRPVDVDFDPRLATTRLLPVEEEMQAYRIVQEAVGNAVRHSAADNIRIGLHVVRGSRLQIEVTDDGRGFTGPDREHSGMGLQGMRERAAAIGGSLSLESGLGAGTRVRLQLPLRVGVTFAEP